MSSDQSLYPAAPIVEFILCYTLDDKINLRFYSVYLNILKTHDYLVHRSQRQSRS